MLATARRLSNPSDFKVYTGANVERIGVPIAIVSTDSQSGRMSCESSGISSSGRTQTP
jgi:hypothetical protein